MIKLHAEPVPRAVVSVGLDIDIPDADDLIPTVDVRDFRGVQPYKLVFFGEKSSLADVLEPIANERAADLYLPTGEISDTLLHTMAAVGAEDGRPMIVLTFSDCDPAGWQMPISIGRKLQAFQTLLYPELEFAVYRVALTPDQVRAYGLPSTPLKDSERRADRWRSAMGVSQTEIDALASLQPELMRQVALDAIAPFYDTTLDRRVATARNEWRGAAQEILDEQLDSDGHEHIRIQAAARLDDLREEIDRLTNLLDIDVDDIEFPRIDVPEAEVTEDAEAPLIDSAWSFEDQTQALIDSKSYDE